MRSLSWARPLRLLLLAALLAAAAAALVEPARAATITVTTAADESNADGDCSLREAIRAANDDIPVDGCAAGSGADTIVLPAGAYVLSLAGTGEDRALTGDLDIHDDLTIAGAGKDVTIIEGNRIDRVLQVSAAVTLSELTITGGDSGTEPGGGISLGGELTLLRSRVRGNAGRGGIVVFGTATLTSIESRISDNESSVNGGGIFNYGTTHLIRSLVDGNVGLVGGGVFSQGTLTLVNSTVSGNSALSQGGGIATAAAASLHNVTVAQNDAPAGGGVFVYSLGTLDVRSSVIADNVDTLPSTPDADCAGTLVSQGYNLIEDTRGCTILGVVAHNITGADPALGPLQANGGPTLTHALRPASPAVDAGAPAGCVDAAGLPLAVDQRGYARPGRCDLGAFEQGSPGPPTPTATSTPSTTPSFTPTATPSATPSATSTATSTATPSATPTRLPGEETPPIPGTTTTPSPTRPAEGPAPTPEQSLELLRVYLPLVAR